MRIVYCLDNVYSLGGIARITLVKANALSKIEGNSIFICVLDEKYVPQMQINDEINVVNLGVIYQESGTSRLMIHLKNTLAKFLHYISLYKNLNKIQPDIVVSTGQKGTHLLQWIPICSHPKKIREYHFVRNYMDYQCHSRLSWMKNRLERLYDNITRFYGYDLIAILTKEDVERNWNGNKKVIIVPNPITGSIDKKSSCDNKIMIAAGRLHEQKNFASMIRVWQSVYEKHPDWQLHIYGDGWLKSELEEQISTSKYPNAVRLMGKTDRMLEKMSEASAYIMTSEFEGLPLVLIEAMSVGLPIVSYACPCGPKDIISEGKDGFLVTIHDEKNMSERISWLIEHDKERKEMGENAVFKSRKYQIDPIISTWMSIFKS